MKAAVQPAMDKRSFSAPPSTRHPASQGRPSSKSGPLRGRLGFFSGAALAALATALVTSIAPATADFRRRDRVVVDREAFTQELGQLARQADDLENVAQRMNRPGLARRAAALESRLGNLAQSLADAPAYERDHGRDRDRRRAMNDGDFGYLLQALERSAFASDDMALIGQVAESQWFTVAQVKTLAEQFAFASDKIEVMVRLNPRLVDPENAWKLEECLSFTSDRETYRKRIAY